MRWLVSGAFWLMGGLLLYPYTQGAFLGPGGTVPPGDPWGSALAPLWSMSLQGVVVLVAGVMFIVCGITIHFWNRDFEATSGVPLRWSKVLQAGFSVNVLVAALLILGLSLAIRDAVPASTVGNLYILSCVAVLVGSFLAFALFWQHRSRWLYGSTLLIHLVEIGSVAAVFVMGIRE